jgi:hypothetical protein
MMGRSCETAEGEEGLMAEDANSPVTTRDYVVHGPAGDVEFTAIAEIEVGPRAELILKGADGGCAAVIAPGHWWRAHVCDDPDAGG